MPEPKDKAPWTAFAAPAYSFEQLIGCGQWENRKARYAINPRACSVWGDGALPDQVCIVMTHDEDGKARLDCEMELNRVVIGLQRRMSAKPLGLLLREYSWPTGMEAVFRCTDGRLAAEKLRPLVEGVPNCTIITLHDPDWQEPREHARNGKYLERLEQAIEIADKNPPPPPTPARKDHPATTSTRAFRSWVRKHPPRFLDGLLLDWVDKRIKPLNEVAVAFDVRHPAGAQCKVHRHLLDDYYMSPVHLSWRADAASAPTAPAICFDSDVHGYDAEVEPRGVHTHKRGDGVGPPARCPLCGGEWHYLRAIIDYAACSDLADEPHDWPVQNYFQVLVLETRCVNCGRKQRPFVMGDL